MPRSMMALVERRALNNPDAIALLAPARPPLTFGALVREVERAAQSFAAMGLARGSRIAVALPNGPEMAVMLLAATDCAACAPLNPSSDAAQSGHLLQVLSVDALVVPAGEDSPLIQAANALGVQIVRLAFSTADPAGVFQLSSSESRVAAPAMASAPDDVALLLHTSGTTALPRVATFTRRYLVELSIARASLLRMTHSDRCLCVVPMFAAAAIRRNLFPTLAVGGSVACPAGMDPAAFIDWLDTFRPSFYTGTPAMQRAVMDALDRHGSPRHTLRFVLSASGALDPTLQRRLEVALGVPVLQTYGTTEIGTIAQESLWPTHRRAGSVGVPADCEVAILDAAGAFLPPPGEGEIVVRGLLGFGGYDNDADASRSAFLDGWYRTGDLGYLDADGYLFLTGRVKEQINRGGFKVSPAEVDAALLSHPDVAEAGTFGVPHSTLGEDVMTAVVLRRPGVASAQQMRDYALGRLAAYKVPTRILIVPELPKTATGKIKRGDLAKSFGSSRRVDYVAPRGASEALACRVFAEVLGLARVGVHDNFFELGGDSLRGAQVIVRINADLGLDLSPILLFRRPTAAEIAAELDALASGPALAPPPPIPRRTRHRDSAT